MLRLPKPIVHIEKDHSLLSGHGFREFADFMESRAGVVVSRKRGRHTVRLELDGRVFYLKRNKLHWHECLKALTRFKLPPRNAVPEWENIAAVRSIGIGVAERVAVGEKRILGREVASFIMTEALHGARSLEESAATVFAGKAAGDALRRKHKLIDAIAAVGRQLHGRCMYHQDFYLSHFYLGPSDELYLIDLQRVIRRSSPSGRYMIKDLAQLNYSAETTGRLSRTDRLRFFVRYRGIDKLGPGDKALIRKIMAKSRRIAAHTVKLLERRRRRGELP